MLITIDGISRLSCAGSCKTYFELDDKRAAEKKGWLCFNKDECLCPEHWSKMQMTGRLTL